MGKDINWSLAESTQAEGRLVRCSGNPEYVLSEIAKNYHNQNIPEYFVAQNIVDTRVVYACNCGETWRTEETTKPQVCVRCGELMVVRK
jgi:hypothetical protein